MKIQFNPLTIKAVNNPIKEASTISFDFPECLATTANYQYYPGQYLILKLNIDGKEYRRSYSLNSNPYEDDLLQITVKRVKGGIVSNYINDHFATGMKINASIPQGSFFVDIARSDYKTYFLFAAGSGITPIISILKSVLSKSKDSFVYLFYGNRDQTSILFEAELNELIQKYPKHLKVQQTLSKPKVWSTWKQWSGRKGRIDADAVEWFINQHPPIAQTTEYYACGPGAMTSTIQDVLVNLEVPKSLIHIEQFGAAKKSPPNKGFENALLKVQLNQQSNTLSIPKGKTILQTLKAANLEPPYSCESGVCGTCKAKVISGEVSMNACMALDDEEIKKGVILTCRAVPMTPEISIEF
jgi:ring-1,2-phenylacetyl-CoA epoxidase subunit PaaE